MIDKSSPGYVLSFMALLCIVFGSGIAVVHYATADIMAQNDRLLQDKKLTSAFLLPIKKGASAEEYRTAFEANVTAFTATGGNRSWELYRKISQPDSGAIGFVFSGVGFWDLIRGILVVSPDLSTIINIEFLKQAETPGLGARIEEEWFKKQFRGRTIAWNAPENKRIVIGASPDPTAENRVDAVAGATQTSIAIMKSLNTELARFKAMYQVNATVR